MTLTPLISALLDWPPRVFRAYELFGKSSFELSLSVEPCNRMPTTGSSLWSGIKPLFGDKVPPAPAMKMPRLVEFHGTGRDAKLADGP